MIQFFEYITEFNVASVVLRLILAVIVGGLIGLERGRHGAQAGLRTHILVCVGATVTALTGVYLVEIGFGGDVARLSAQVISGIGFLGAGMILVRGNSVIRGLTTAAGMWATAAIGIALGYGFYIGAIVGAALCIFCVTVLSRLERAQKNVLNVYIELNDIKQIQAVVRELKDEGFLASYDIIPAKSGRANNTGIICTLNEGNHYESLKLHLRQRDSVDIVVSDINL